MAIKRLVICHICRAKVTAEDFDAHIYKHMATRHNPIKTTKDMESYLARAKGDKAAGHTGAIDYWEGAAAGALVALNTNPLIRPEQFFNSNEYQEYKSFKIHPGGHRVTLLDKNGKILMVPTMDWFSRLQKLEQKAENKFWAPKGFRDLNPILPKGAMKKIGGKIMYYAGRTIYPSKAKMVSDDLKSQGISTVLKRDRSLGTLIYASQKVYPDLSEPVWNPKSNPIKVLVTNTKNPTCPSGHALIQVNPGNYVCNVCSKSYSQKNPILETIIGGLASGAGLAGGFTLMNKVLSKKKKT
jgi:hypothetical protein